MVLAKEITSNQAKTDGQRLLERRVRFRAAPWNRKCQKTNGNHRADKREEVVMPILRKLKEMLDEAKISYEVHSHLQAFTAHETAARQHLSGKDMAKVVMLRVDGSLAMAVIPASRMISLNAVKASLGAKEVKLATEDEFASLFPECEIGAMPPFGNLFDLPVYVDPTLEEDETIFFNAGNHEQTVKMEYRDFARLVQPRVIRLVKERQKKAA
jgi:Ala-tRNA(Pro) deacylase